MDIHEAPVCVDCRFLDRERARWPRTCQHVRVNTDRDLVTGDPQPLDTRIVSESEAPSCYWARYLGPCGHMGALFEPQPDFRLEAGKYYIDARGRRTRLVRGLTAPMPGLFHDGGARVWKADGTAQTAGDPDLLALSSNQENSHD